MCQLLGDDFQSIILGNKYKMKLWREKLFIAKTLAKTAIIYYAELKSDEVEKPSVPTQKLLHEQTYFKDQSKGK